MSFYQPMTAYRIQKTSNLGAEVERFFVFGNLNLKSSQNVLNLPVIVFQ